jgi:nucleotide-binding universal stress UspA family protein
MPEARPYRFLVAIDGSRGANRATEYVVWRACDLRPCEVHLVMVRHARIQELLTAAQRDVLMTAALETEDSRRLLDRAGLAYDVHMALGDPAREIIALAKTLACDEVVVGTRGMSPIDNLLLGSIAYKIAHASPVPVSVVPDPHGAGSPDQQKGGTAHRILLAVDGSPSCASAVGYVKALCDARMPVEIRILNVQRPIVSGNVRRLLSQETIENYWQKESEPVLDGARLEIHRAGLKWETQMRVGHPGDTIVKDAKHWGATRIVMGTRGLAALGSVVLGSTALRVIHLSEIPVTLVKVKNHLGHARTVHPKRPVS